MRLTIVGCSGSLSGPTSAASCYLVQADDADGRTWNLVMDLGPGAHGALMRAVDPRELDALFLTHLHPDHMADVASLQVYLRYHPEGPTGPLATFGPEGTTDRMAAVCWVPPAELAEQFRVRELVAGTPVDVGPLRVEPVRMRHPVPAFGFRVSGPGELPGSTVRLAYTGDTDSCAGADELADGADLLLAEASFQEGREDDVRGIHLTGRRAGELAAGGDGRRPAALLVLTHLPPWTSAETVLAEAGAAYDGPVELATPGATWAL